MMKAFPADAHAPVLARLAAQDPEPRLRDQAARALRTQKITAAWEAGMIALLDAPDASIRTLAAQSVERRFDATILAALRKRAAVETDPATKAALAQSIATQSSHQP